MRTALVIIFFLLLFMPSSVSAQTSTPPPVLSITDTPFPACTPPPCSSYEYLTCGNSNGCPGGCGTICQEPPVEEDSEPVTIPEPVSILLLGTGLAGLAGYAAARKR